MNTRKSLLAVMASLFVLAPVLNSLAADEPVVFQSRNMGGPRFGMTYVVGDGQLTEELDHHNMGRTISQFGWHFEHQVIPQGGGPRFLIEFVPMLAGVEYGKVIPNFTLAMGVRGPGGMEFGMGPNMMLAKTVDDDIEARTSLLLAVGKSFDYGGVSIPLNLAYSTSPEGDRISMIMGYAIGKKESAKKIEAEPLEPQDHSLTNY